MTDTFTINTEEQIRPTATPYKPEVFDIVYSPISTLNNMSVIPEFDFGNPPVDANVFASKLVETCKLHNGVGLSANQCGFLHRVFVMGSGDEYVAFFNPKILKYSDKKVRMLENSLSTPFLELKLDRPVEIVVEYQDFIGEKHQKIFNGLSARIFQHQLDNLDKVMFHSLAKPLALEMALKKQRKMFKKLGIRL
jgi:peptide deformylase